MPARRDPTPIQIGLLMLAGAVGGMALLALNFALLERVALPLWRAFF